MYDDISNVPGLLGSLYFPEHMWFESPQFVRQGCKAVVPFDESNDPPDIIEVLIGKTKLNILDFHKLLLFALLPAPPEGEIGIVDQILQLALSGQFISQRQVIDFEHTVVSFDVFLEFYMLD